MPKKLPSIGTCGTQIGDIAVGCSFIPAWLQP
jgi:hypothetical protein